MAKPPPVRAYPIPTRRHPPHRVVPLLPRRRAWYQVPSVVTGAALLALIALLSLAVPAVVGCSAIDMDIASRLEAPSRQHWLGTDAFGRDVLCRTLQGGRVSLPVGLLAVCTSVVPGLALGLLAGYYRGWLDTSVSTLTDLLLAFPSILMALLVIAWLGVGVGNAMLAIGLAGIPRYTRLVRANALHLERSWFVRAARTVGCTDARILIRHILPNVLPTVLALAAVDVAWAILNAAALSFLGLGAQPPTPEWGAIINEGRGFLRQAPWITLAPGAMLTLTALAINLLGDGLREGLDPKSR
ncbi:MAG: ABC transporter permease [Anaerolineae bacterium]|nr:ABC transporter permease [Anaerolineae bacterium]